jgi:hypothetical protein
MVPVDTLPEGWTVREVRAPSLESVQAVASATSQRKVEVMVGPMVEGEAKKLFVEKTGAGHELLEGTVALHAPLRERKPVPRIPQALAAELQASGCGSGWGSGCGSG